MPKKPAKRRTATSLPRKEAKLTPKQLEDALVRLEKFPPDVVDEAEFRRRLRETTIHRYQVALGLLEDVEDVLLAAKSGSTVSETALDLAVEKLDHAVVQMTHASLKFNKSKSRSAGIRNVLQPTRDASLRTPAQRMAAILRENEE